MNELVEDISWWKRNWKWLIPISGIIIISCIIFFTSGLSGITSELTQAYSDTELYENALEKVKSDKRAIEILGEIQPIDNFAILEGSVKYSANYKTVNSSIRLKGAKGKGMMDITANRIDSKWNYEKINLRIEKPTEKKQTIEIIKANPNIILVMTDDQGWFDAGFNGNKKVRTPNLDKLAENGIIFNRFYSASAVCSPTRASVLTGRNPLRINIPTANSGHMKKEEITISELLKKQNYATGHFGKWHLGTLTKDELDANRGGKAKFENDYSTPTMHGYDEYFCTESKVPTFDPMLYPASFDTEESKRYGWKAIDSSTSSLSYGTSYWSQDGKVTDNLKGENSRVIMDRAISFIANTVKKKTSFFSTIWLHTPHLPVATDSLNRSYYQDLSLKEQLYFGSITAMDEQIGRLWNKLEKLGIQDDTIIWFCSDNGPERETPGSAGIFRERKRSLYEGGIRVPAFVVWKNHLNGGFRLDTPVVTSDYLPTILEMLNLDYPDDRPMDGESIWKLLQGEKSKRKMPIGFIYNQSISWVNDEHKLISVDKGKTYELYDLTKDKGETKNIILEKPEITKKMKLELLNWKTSVNRSKDGADYR